ncbi:hypothetical protein EDB81DRAFT_873145 [Dactylonectria macrodidyma]|uniref:NAD-dependent epimerase/dehydratase domain-containing protein n=1 Tax=Dactylonectria macrodidyma TaxID=307937 RepID=A0A9P9DFB7_9HYPO|nr:hypothetical protein EDB81DRAFT_954277 [Dactylonectria macrodidyma]KAH7118360.1 hypothetical protein EDB81DRAFT_873145 [Dactylonectria macrodidyma]
MSKSLVTGGTGFIGLYVVKLLLEHGHHVNTTVRSLTNKAKCKPLLDLQGQFPGRLSLFEADLVKAGSFLQAMSGCQVVYHIASPFLTPSQIKDGFKDCVEPALEGTRNVLESVNKTESVTRVVLTSSISAMYGDSKDVLSMKNATLSESSWNETSSVTHYPYAYSKLIAEREAWKLHDAQSRWSLVVINPGLVIGPSLSPETASGSLFMLEALYRGENKMGSPDLSYPVVDVREVAEAHVKVGENTATKGRYIISGDHTVSLLDMANFVRPIHQNPKALPCWNMPKVMIYLAGPFIGITKKWADGNVGIGFKVDNTRAIRELGMAYTPAEQVLQTQYRSWAEQQSSK